MKAKECLKRALRYIIKGIPEKKVDVKVASLAQSELLKGRTALITGGTSGIGRAIAEAFYMAGANVIVSGRTEEKAKQVASEIKKMIVSESFVAGFAMDNSKISDFEEKLGEMLSVVESKKIDILVNNAGTMGKNGGWIKNCTEEEYDSILTLNLKASFFLCKTFAKYMIDNSINGNILNIASSSSLRPCVSAYMLSKWGIRGLTEGLARMFAPYGIVVNGIAPGPTATPMLKKEDDKNFSLPSNLSGRYAHPCEIANMAVVLTSDMGRMVVGDIVYMTGGSGVVTNDDISYNF